MTATRRAFLVRSGSIVIGFALLGGKSGGALAQSAGQRVSQAAGATQASGPDATQLDSWLSIDGSGDVTIFSGKVELGTGVRTALAQIAAEELELPFERIALIQGDTARTPDESYTAGSQTIQVGGVNVRMAAATARQVLVNLAAVRLDVPSDQLNLADGVISSIADPGRAVSYADLVGDQRFALPIDANVVTKDPSLYTVVGQPIQRVDLLPKLTGGVAYVQDLRLPSMLHARVIHPSGVNARLAQVNESSITGLPGVLKIVRSGSFLAVVAEREEQAISAASQLQVTWDPGPALPSQDALSDYLLAQQTQDKIVTSTGDPDEALRSNSTVLQATYTQPYQLHASIGPSCAVAEVTNGQYTVYCSTQGVYQLRGAIAQLLNTGSDQVRVVYMESAGCYGDSGADHAAGEAALLAQAMGRPVRVQWMRQDEHAWEPKGPAMVMRVRGALDDTGRVAGWDYQVWTPTHTTRSGGQAGNLLPGRLIEPPPAVAANPNFGGDVNATTNYGLGANRVTAHWLPLSASPLRPSALRSLGALANTFANESFMDELAASAESDPLEFRLTHLDDPRAAAVLQAAADQFGWQPRTVPGQSGSGQGLAFARYVNALTYVATMVDLTVDSQSGQVTLGRVVVAHDCGLIINPDGLKNQIEGNVIQSASRAMLEQVNFDTAKITSVDWNTYPIFRFDAVPRIDVVLVDHPDQPAWGAGECATLTTGAAIANAIFWATGARVRDIPLTPARVLSALAQAG
jgi:CO/xanthine dehydrogenase Mo-binding subunit